MKINPRFLRSHQFLSLLPSATLRKLAGGTDPQDVRKGTVLFTQGQPATAMYLIVSGRCESRHIDASQHLVTQVHGPGDTLGDREVIAHAAYLSTVTVATQSVVLKIPAEELQAAFDSEPKVAGRLSQSIVRKIVEGRKPSAGKRIVALHTLSPRIHERILGRRISDVLAELTHHDVLSVHFTRGDAAVSLADWPGIEPALNGHFQFRENVREVREHSFELDIQIPAEMADPSAIAPLLSHLGTHFDFVLIDAGREIAVPVLMELLVQSDLAYVLMHPDNECLYSLKLLTGQLPKAAGGMAGAYRHISPIICADTFQNAARFAEDCERIGYPVHSILRGFPIAEAISAMDRSPFFATQIRRLAREIGRCRVGLALSSGGARGLAHVGVIQVLEENGIEIDAVAGASMGAYVGSVWCYGHDGVTCEKIARSLESRWGLLHLVDPVIPPRQGFLRTRRAGRRLRRTIGDTRFVELARPLRVVATDFETLDRVVFASGEVASSVEASIAIPGVCVPYEWNGHMLIDGGIADPLPVDVLTEMGVERIIAVNTIPTPEYIRGCMECALETAPPANPRPSVRAFFNKHLNYFAKGNLCDILMRANFGGQMRVAEQAGHMADIVLRPWSCDSRWHDFTNPGKYIALGRKVAEEQLAALKKLSHPYEKPTAALALAG